MSSRAPPAYTLASKSEGWRESVVAAAAARVAMRVRWRRSSSDGGGELLSGTVAAADADPDVGRDVATDRFAIRVRWRWTSSTVDGGSVGASLGASNRGSPGSGLHGRSRLRTSTIRRSRMRACMSPMYVYVFGVFMGTANQFPDLLP